MTQQTNWSLLDFETQTNKSSRWFWGLNHQIGAVNFEVQSGKPEPPVLRPNRRKLSPPVVRSNRRKPSKWFWVQTTNKSLTLILRLNQETRDSHLHVHGTDRTWRSMISRSSVHWVPDICDYPRSSASGLLLLSRCSCSWCHGAFVGLCFPSLTLRTPKFFPSLKHYYQSSFSNAYHKYFLSMLVLLCSFPPYTFSRCAALSGDVFCPIVSCVTARDNRLRRIERLMSSRF
jgi:hypothetical protein